mgnify:CR=1 FL=1
MAPSLLIIVLLAACGSGSSGDATASSTTPPVVGTPDPTTAPTQVVTPSAASAPTDSAGGDDSTAPDPVDLAADQLEAVDIDQAVGVDNVILSIGAISSQELTAGAGEVGGPGIIVPVVVANTSDAEVSLSGLVTTVSYGDTDIPASELISASDEIPPTLAPGEALVIERAFLVPAEGRSHVRIVVDMGADYQAAVFEGPAPQ